MRILVTGRRHGYGIAKLIQIVSGKVLQMGQGSLYPALHRLEKRGFIRAIWKDSETGRRAKFYSLKTEGKRKNSEQEAYWIDFSNAVNLILKKG